MSEVKSKVRTTEVSFQEFSDYEFIPPATFFIQNALGSYIYIHTSKREVAQSWVDDHYGKGRYTVKASKIQKGAGGPLSCTGTATRKGQKAPN